MPKDALLLDFETFSACNLKKAGVYRYAEDPSTRVLCAAYQFFEPRQALRRSSVRVWSPIIDPHIPNDLRDALRDNEVEIHAWNAAFERQMIAHVLHRNTSGWTQVGFNPALGRYHDTMIRAAYYGLPLGLSAAGVALGVTHRKSATGHGLMLRMCKPRSVDPTTGAITAWHEDPVRGRDMLDELMRYCADDVRAEMDILMNTPDLPTSEQDLWVLDQMSNDEGFLLDGEFIRRLAALTAIETKHLDKKLRVLTNKEVQKTSQVTALTRWIESQGVSVYTLARNNLEELLRTPELLPPNVLEALSLRLLASRSSTAKLETMLQVRCRDARARGTMQFYGAPRTGRDSGRLIQPQNFPRGVHGVPVELAAEQNTVDDTREVFELFSPTDLMTSCASSLRGTIIAKPGHVLVVVDASQIEARLIAWLAGQDDVVAVFARGDDVYTYAAAQQGSTVRQFGKVLVLACGFSMGPGRFQETAKTYGLKLSAAEAETAVKLWRQNNDRVVSTWYDYHRAVVDAIMFKKQTGFQRGTVIGPAANLIDTLEMTLPSGRSLYYRNPRMVVDPVDLNKRPVHSGVDPLTKNWTDNLKLWGGFVFQNAVQALARDLLMLTVKRMFLMTDRVPVLRVHDELVYEVPVDEGPRVLDLLKRCMRKPPIWGARNAALRIPTLPLDANGFICTRYRKG